MDCTIALYSTFTVALHCKELYNGLSFTHIHQWVAADHCKWCKFCLNDRKVLHLLSVKDV